MDKLNPLIFQYELTCLYCLAQRTPNTISEEAHEELFSRDLERLKIFMKIPGAQKIFVESFIRAAKTFDYIEHTERHDKILEVITAP